MKHIAIIMTLAIAGHVSAAFGADAKDGSAARGKVIFLRDGCYLCHGTQGQGGSTAARLAPDPLPLDAMIAYVRAPNIMPAYGEHILKDEELADIHAYLASIPGPPPVSSIPILKDLK